MEVSGTAERPPPFLLGVVLMPGPRSRLEADGNLSAIVADRLSGMPWKEVARKWPQYPLDTTRRVVAKAMRAAKPDQEPDQLDQAADVIRLDRALVTMELLRQYRDASREFETSLTSGNRGEAIRWHRQVVALLDMMAKAAGIYAPEAATQVVVPTTMSVSIRREELAAVINRAREAYDSERVGMTP